LSQPPLPVPDPSAAMPKPQVREATDSVSASRESMKRRLFVPAMAVLVAVGVALWVGLRPRSSQPSSERTDVPTAASQHPETSRPAPPEISALSSRHTQPSANRSTSVLRQVIPDVPHRTRDAIHGHIKVAVRVTVDSSGNVVGETLENPGPSKYFARLATEAARKWKFAPVDDQGSRKWLLRFEFSRGGATGHAIPPKTPQ
jgi:TonB family protein